MMHPRDEEALQTIDAMSVEDAAVRTRLSYFIHRWLKKLTEAADGPCQYCDGTMSCEACCADYERTIRPGGGSKF